MSAIAEQLTVPEAAERTGLSTYALYRRMRRGDIPFTVADGRHECRIDADVLDAYVAAGAPLSRPRSPRYLPGWMSVADVAQATGYSMETVRRLCNEDVFESRRWGGPRSRIWISRASFDAFASQLPARG